MMTTLRHRTALQPALLLTVGAVIALCLAALACGPAAQEEGAAGAAVEPAIIPTATAAATPTGEAAWDGVGELPPIPTLTQMERQYPNLGVHFIRKIQQYEAAANGAENAVTPIGSGQPAPTSETFHLVITVDSPERVDEVQRFLEESGASQIKCVKFPKDYISRGKCSAVVSISRLRALADLPGVIRVERMVVMEPASDLHSPHLQQSVADAHGITAWRWRELAARAMFGGSDSRFWRAVGMEVRDDARRVLPRYQAIRRPINLAQEGLRYDDDAAPPHCPATGPARDGGGRDCLVPGRAGLRAGRAGRTLGYIGNRG